LEALLKAADAAASGVGEEEDDVDEQ
jgi:hypothetical protein